MSESQKTDGGIWVNIGGKKDKAHINIYDNDPRGEHESIHINLDYNDGTAQIVETNGEEKEVTDCSCFITTATMRHTKGLFYDNCEELEILRWFRDNFGRIEDVAHYYKTAPYIVEAINNEPNCNQIYEEIYEKVILVCVKLIQKGDYKTAYNLYANSTLTLEERFARNELNQRLINILNLRLN